MPDSDEMLHQIGAFDAPEVEKLVPALEAEGITYELEEDALDVNQDNLQFQRSLGMCPALPKILVFVPEAAVARAEPIVQRLFPK
ncbi:hypothetical protein [Opitutus sp. ER46]|uniref:hypothetical protein n=1 Tax=Opitutus sp. ER46 TaxID=2161864 RepID=UPI000D30CD7A|nr:hypothetical protein [Opitutus sp. ER46]PTX97880.1 hypothetical protein DB354_06265 [Opitutus sp. ER46]